MSISLTVMTFNLHDDQAEDSPNSWSKRRGLCISVITSYSPMILCTQQGVKFQLDYLQSCFTVDLNAWQVMINLEYQERGLKTLQMSTALSSMISRRLSESLSVPGSTSWGSEVPCIATWAISFHYPSFYLHFGFATLMTFIIAKNSVNVS
ncbi:hypothetical protein SAY87_018119 [Trapa incisa]|uniref:Uncharacterized protein n=1 Tax=Trapa incisa TaxID=236973 RepID=A0AAN7QTH7_9MYRT|nr:hypothetical protein SAY87_018119 [Trapa incisa]